MKNRKTLAMALLAVATLASNAVTNAAPLSERHTATGLKCESCHGDGVPSGIVSQSQCLACHGGSYEALAKKTDGGDINFHDSHVDSPDCGQCHSGHGKPRLLCDECHEFEGVKVP